MAALALIGFVGLIVGGLSVLYPLRFLKIRTRLQGFALLVGSLFLIGYAGANMPPTENTERRSVAAVEAPAQVERTVVPARPIPPARKPLPMPSDQRAFLDAVEKGRDVYSSGKNEMQKGSAKPLRARAICSVLQNLSARNWVGEIQKLSTNSDGKGVLEISIGPKTTLKTTNNSFSDIAYQSLIDPSSNLFAKVSSLNIGDQVVFSGRFFQEAEGCVAEGSMTLRGSIESPDFFMRFTDVAADAR